MHFYIRDLTLFRPAFFDLLGPGGASEAPPMYFQTAYAMATKFAQDSVRANSNHYRYCDVTMTSYDVIMTSFVSQCFT